MNLTEIRLLVLDVDGVLTDGRIGGASGGEAKRFHVHDGYAILQWRRAGGVVALLSGRNSDETANRAKELGIEWVRLGVADKARGLEEILTEADVPASVAAYVGDDGPDLPAMERCGFAVAVADASPAVKKMAHYVTRRGGGRGAAAEVIEMILRKQKRWSAMPLGLTQGG